LRKSFDTFDNTEINATRCVGFVFVSTLACLIINPSFLVWKYGLYALGIVCVMVIISNLIGDLLYMIAIDNIGVGRALSTANSYPFFVALFSVFLLGETTSIGLWVGTAIIIAGLALLNCTKKNSVSPSGKVRSNSLGFIMSIITSILWASSLTIQKWLMTTYDIEALTFTFWRAILLSIIAWNFWYFRKNSEERKHIFNVGFKKWLSPFLAGTFGLALGGLMFAYAIKIVPVSIASPITATNPVIAAIIALFAFKEKLSLIQWLGIIMVIIGGIQVSS